jgi:hypothetical protein
LRGDAVSGQFRHFISMPSGGCLCLRET